jgi:hypothetical protein
LDFLHGGDLRGLRGDTGLDPRHSEDDIAFVSGREILGAAAASHGSGQNDQEQDSDERTTARKWHGYTPPRKKKGGWGTLT